MMRAPRRRGVVTPNLAQQAGVSIQQIQSGTQEVGLAVDGISSAIREQSAAITDVATQISRIAAMTERNSTETGNITQVASEIEILARSLDSEVSKFRLAA